MFCKECGKEIDDKAVICVHCGAETTPMPMGNARVPQVDEPSTLLKVVSFLIPLVGLILFIVMNDSQPISAKAYGKFALIGFIIGVVLILIFAIGGCALLVNM